MRVLRQLLEQTERGRYATETTAPLAGKAAAIVMTANAPEHYLAQDSLVDLTAAVRASAALQALSPQV